MGFRTIATYFPKMFQWHFLSYFSKHNGNPVSVSNYLCRQNKRFKKLIVPNSAVYWIIYNRNLITGAEEYI